MSLREGTVAKWIMLVIAVFVIVCMALAFRAARIDRKDGFARALPRLQTRPPPPIVRPHFVDATLLQSEGQFA